MKKHDYLFYAVLALLVINIAASAIAVAHYKKKCNTLEAELASLKNSIRQIDPLLVAKPDAKASKPEAAELRKDVGDSSRKLLSKLKDMRRRLEESERKMAEFESGSPKRAQKGGAQIIRSSPSDSENYVEHFNKLQEKDPAQLQAEVQSVRSFASFSSNVLNERRNFYEGLDVSLLDKEQLDIHNRFLEMNNDVLELYDKISQSDIPEEIASLMDRRNVLLPEYFKLLGGERKTALLSFAKSIGYDSEDALQFIDYINYLDSMTRPRAYVPEGK